MLDRDTILRLARESAFSARLLSDDGTVDRLSRFAAEVERLTLESAAQGCIAVLDEKEESRAEVASRKAKGTPDELARLRHWMTVSTFNAGVRRCIAAIRALGEKT